MFYDNVLILIKTITTIDFLKQPLLIKKNDLINEVFDKLGTGKIIRCCEYFIVGDKRC